MNSAAPLDYGTLNWVKGEIDETLKQARHTLEAFAADPKDVAQIRFCANHLHQVRGTLQMIELYGAALLAEEMEQLAQSLLNQDIARADDAHELLMRAILQLPDYLERLQTGLPDNPLILLPLLNESRTLRGLPLLLESALFAPDLAVVKPAVPLSAPREDVRLTARKLRTLYQRGLVEWHRDLQAPAPLKHMQKVIARLEEISRAEPLVQLWWVTGGVLDALIERGLEANAAIESLFGQVDRQIKRLIELGEAEWALLPPHELVKSLLYHLAHARATGARVQELKRAFRLDELLPAQEQIAAASASLAAPNLELLRTVTAVIKEDLTKIKDGLDIFVRSEQRDPTGLQAVQGALRQTADTLGMLGLGVPRQLLLDQVVALQAVAQGRAAFDDAGLMALAGAVLHVESALDDLVAMQQHDAAASDTRAQSPAAGVLNEAEYRHLLSAVIREAKADMSRVKDDIMGFINAPMRHSMLVDVPRVITRIMGSLSMLAQDRVATVLAACKKLIHDELVERQTIPSQSELDALAEVISGVEYYLEALDEERADRTEILERAEARMAALKFSAAPALGAETPPSAAARVRTEEIDEEIIEIFLEEADEVLATIAAYLPQWKHNNADRNALTTVRRSFHTLKGSGRMVGAAQVGEFAWAFENMLNRVIDGTVDVKPQIFDLIERAQKILPQLIAHFKGVAAAPVETQALMDEAKALSLNAPLALTSTPPAEEELPAATLVAEEPSASVSAEQPEPPQRAAASMQSDALQNGDAVHGETPDSLISSSQGIQPPAVHPRIDPVLRDIFTREAMGHLAAIEKFIDHCRQQPHDCYVTDALLRTLHTLHGSAGMAGVQEIAEPSDMLEKYAKHLSLHQTPLNAEITGALRDSVAFVRAMLVALANSAAPRPAADQLMATLTRLYEAEMAAQTTLARAHPVEQRAESVHASGVEKDGEIVEIYLEEAREILDTSEQILQQWLADQHDKRLLEELQREIHTLKGGARMAGISAMGDLSHALETMVTAVVDGQLAVSAPLAAAMQQTQDRLLQMLDYATTGRPLAPAQDLIELIEALTAHAPIAETPHAAPQPPAVAEPETKPAADVIRLDEWSAQPETEAAPEVEQEEALEFEERRSRVHQEQVRVRADLLDNLVNFAAEISISRSRLEQQVGAFKYNLEEMDQIVARLRGQLRKLEIETEAQILFRYTETASRHEEEFDPLEFDRFSLMQQLSRSLLESVSDLASIEALLQNLTRESETLLVQQARVNTDLHEGLMRTRMVQLAVLLPRMRRIVRQTCQELDKKVELRVAGAEGEMDRTVLDRIVPSLEHMLRNAIDHGIESAELRRAAGKPETGVITLTLSREGSEVVIRIGDDGRGLNLPAIRAKAIERGLLNPKADVTDNELMQFILEPGFSTAQQVTQISGRGVGMDVVNSELKQLGGSLHIASGAGIGTTFTLRLPLTLSINRALLVQIGDDSYAIPLTSIERIVQLTHDELERLYGVEHPVYEGGGQSYQLLYLDTLLGGSRAPLASGRKKFPVLLGRAGDHRVALQVDALLGSREIVVKSVGPQISSVRGITGATILGDGRVVLILDIASLLRGGAGTTYIKHEDSAPAPAAGAITVMVVDDSITVRKVTSRLLERHNMQVLTAKDGVDAVALLQDHIPDVMLLDIEMPRMDGYELATHMRNEERLKHIPIIMITSRTGDKHRDRAMQIGVNKYMGKPYQESELLDNIVELAGRRGMVH